MPADTIKSAVQQTVEAMRKDPAVGPMHTKAVTRLGPDLVCETSDGKFTMKTDMPKQVGGGASAPSPGGVARMALSSCLAVGYGIWMARMDLPYDAIEVELESDLNQRGFLAVDEQTSPGFWNLRVKVNIASTAPRERVEQAIEQADRHSPVLHLVTHAAPVQRELNLTVPAPAPAA